MLDLRTRFYLFYRSTAFLALLAMLVPVVTSLVHHPVVKMADLPMPPMHMGGMDMSPTGSSNADTSKKTPDHKLPACPICQSMHLLGGGFVPPDALLLVSVFISLALYIFSAETLLIKSRAKIQGQPRAPPILA